METLVALTILSALVYLALASYTFLRGMQQSLNRGLFGMCVLLGIYCIFQALMYTASSDVDAWTWHVFGVMCWALFLPGFPWMALTVARREAPSPVLTLGMYIPSVFVAVRSLTLMPNGPGGMSRTLFGWARNLDAEPMWVWLLGGITVAFVLGSLILIGWRAVRSHSRRERLQALWMVWTGCVALLTAIVFIYVFPLTVSPEVPRIPQIIGVIWAIGFAVAIIRYRLIDMTPSLAAEAILGGIQDLVLLLDKTGRIQVANPRSEPLLGESAESLRGRRIEKMGPDGQGIRAAFETIRERSEPGPGIETSFMCADGNEVPVLLTGAAVDDRDRDRVGVALVVQDLRPMRELLKTERIESIGILAGGIAHDFNNLLTAIGGYVSLASLDMAEGSEARRRLHEAENACRRAQALTQQLLTFSRGGAPIRKSVDLHEIVREAAAFGTSGSRVLVEFDFPKDLWRVDGDEGQISQVIHNLVLNAVQAMPRGGTMRIRAWNIAKGVPGIGGGQTSAARVRLEMSDEGEGIPAEHLSRVFDPFFSTKPSGSGLGLATSHSIVRRHGGDITIESARGKGTTVRLELPRSTRPTADLPKVSAGTAVGSGRVLLMDDQLAVRRVAEEMLRRMGYSVVACADGREAVQIHRSAMDAGQPFDLVILDLTVPGGLGGAEALEAIRQVDPSLTAIVSSGFASDGVMAEYREHGFDAALPKPYTPDKLAEVIAKVKRAKAAAQPPRSQE